MTADSSRIPVLEESFQLQRELGRGGFGSVYLGIPRAGGLPAAVKLGIDHGEKDQRLRILREVELLRELRHPRLANLLGLFETRSGDLALVYELVEGVPLSRHLGGRPVDPREAVPWLSDMVEALGYLHAHGVLHRDLKSGNVMIEPNGRARLLDFGLARAVAPGGTITATGLLYGTPEFMAPELFRGDPASPATDQYALAAMVHEWVTGRPPETQAGPFGGGAVDERRLAKLPKALGRALRRALATQLAERPPDLETLFVELEGGLLATPEAMQGATRRVTPPPAEQPDRHAGRDPASTPRRGRALDSTPRRAGVRSVISRKLRSRRLAFRRGSVGLCILVAAVAAWALSRGPSSLPAPPVAASLEPEPRPSGAFGEPFLEALDYDFQELEGLYVTRDWKVLRPAPGLPPPAGARNLLTPDYRYFSLRRERLPSVRRFADWIATGGSPEELSPRVRRQLEAIDLRWAGEGLERPFHPFLYVSPAPGDVPLPGDVVAMGGGTFPTSVSGWLASAVEWSEEALRNQHEMGDQVRRLEDGEDVPVFAGYTQALRLALRLHEGRPLRILGVVDSQPRYREGLGEWIRSVAEPVECMIYAIERHLDGPGRDDLVAARIGHELLRRVRTGYAGHLLGRDVVRILPGLPDTLPQWYFAAVLAEFRLHEMRSRILAIDQAESLYRLAVQEVFGRSKVGDETWPLRSYVLRRYLIFLLEAKRYEEASRELQVWWEEIQAMPAPERATLLSEFYCRDQLGGKPILGLLPEQVHQAERLIRAHWLRVIGNRSSLERSCGPRLGIPVK